MECWGGSLRCHYCRVHDLLCVFPALLPIGFEGQSELVPYLFTMAAFAGRYHLQGYESNSKDNYPPLDRDGIFDRYPHFIAILDICT
jgi:hypothetical protein